jgi:hypothetical protein
LVSELVELKLSEVKSKLFGELVRESVRGPLLLSPCEL